VLVVDARDMDGVDGVNAGGCGVEDPEGEARRGNRGGRCDQPWIFSGHFGQLAPMFEATGLLLPFSTLPRVSRAVNRQRA
jgi:hypothetical protein